MFCYNEIRHRNINNRANSPFKRQHRPPSPNIVRQNALKQNTNNINNTVNVNNINDDFQSKIDELYKFANIINNNVPNNKINDIMNNIGVKFNIDNNTNNNNNNTNNNNNNNTNNTNNNNNNNVNNDINNNITSKLLSNINIKNSNDKKNIIYGIKKTILSDYNSLYISSNSNDFKIGLNKNVNEHTSIYDCFYLFPNISEINTKNETNIINEKKVEYFENKFEQHDIQYFPLDFIPCGINIPMKCIEHNYTKLIIKNIYWNIFQTINIENYTGNELLCTVPEKSEYIYKKIQLYLHIELHSQIVNNNNHKILPYKNDKYKISTPANSCLYKSIPIEIGTLNGSYFNLIQIDLLKDIDISCALLCLKISVPNSSSNVLKGFDKYSKLYHGFIPFSQFIVSLDYELV